MAGLLGHEAGHGAIPLRHTDALGERDPHPAALDPVVSRPEWAADLA